jgi:uncharacterized membrane protein YdjX (TVP38/TMEM64 family)
MKNMTRKDALKFIIFLMLALGLMALGHHFNLQEKFTLEKTRHMIENAGPWRFVIFAFAYSITALIPFPATLLSTVSGAVWGEYIGTFYTVICATMASCIPFAISRLLGRNLIGKMIEKNHTADRCDRFAKKNGFMTVLIMRLVPILPWDMVNYLSGLCGIRFRDYLLASLIGTIPASFTYNLIGASLGQPIHKMKVAMIIFLAVLIAAMIIFIKLKRFDRTKKTDAGRQVMTKRQDVTVEPMDANNQKLVHNAHPSDWNNPEPQKRYNLVVIGAGTAGLVTAAGAAGLGAKVALVEKHLMGGDCLNVGCVPSKAIIHSSRVMAEVRHASQSGINASE